MNDLILFNVHTINNIRYTNTSNKQSPYQMCWTLKMLEFRFEIFYPTVYLQSGKEFYIDGYFKLYLISSNSICLGIITHAFEHVYNVFINHKYTF